MSETKLVLVETVSQFRMRYVVEVPVGTFTMNGEERDKAEWALDTVVMEEAKEFSQHHLGETIVSHRELTQEEYLKLFDVDNDYLKDWDAEQKKCYITAWNEEKKEPEHSEYYYDTDRNR